MQLCKRTERSTSTDSLDWSKKYAVLSISRLYLQQGLSFSTEAVESFTDEDMQRIADMLVAQYFDAEFDEEVRFIVACQIIEKYGGTDEQQESLREDREA